MYPESVEINIAAFRSLNETKQFGLYKQLGPPAL